MTHIDAWIKEVRERLERATLWSANDCDAASQARKDNIENNANLCSHAPTDLATALAIIERQQEALECIASNHKPKHVEDAYWKQLGLARCIDVCVTDTKIARNTLADVEKIVSGE